MLRNVDIVPSFDNYFRKLLTVSMLIHYSMKKYIVINTLYFFKMLKNSGFYIVINKNQITTTNTYYNKFKIY